MKEKVVAGHTDGGIVREKIIIRKIEKPKQKFAYTFFKRIFDLILAFIATAVLFVPMLIIAIIIKLDSKGPVLFSQDRLGQNGKPMKMYKFRSMIVDAEREGAKWADENDTRCTKVGKFLRKYRLDELPQFPLNVIPGNISIVGPRPERKIFYDKFAEYIDGFEQRLYVKPGMTGLAQISGGYDLKPEEKIIFDIEYIENRSFLYDIKIILKTFKVVFSCKGAR